VEYVDSGFIGIQETSVLGVSGSERYTVWNVCLLSSSHAAKILIRDLVSKMWTTFIVLDDGTPDVKNSVDSHGTATVTT
jgi:hypothetical protein